MNKNRKAFAPENTMSTAAFVLGILALISIAANSFVPVMASLSITFAVLSRTDGAWSRNARSAVVISVIALSVFAVMWVFVIYFLQTSGLMTEVENIYNSIDWSSGNAFSDFMTELENLLYSRFFSMGGPIPQ